MASLSNSAMCTISIFAAGLGEPEKFATLVELWEKDDNPAQKLFVRVQHYYDVLKEKYEHANELDDDDF